MRAYAAPEQLPSRRISCFPGTRSKQNEGISASIFGCAAVAAYFLDLLLEVLVLGEIPGVVFPAVQVPAFGTELLERLVEFERRAQRCNQVLDDLRLAQSLDGIACLRQRRQQQKPSDLTGRIGSVSMRM